MLSAFLLSALLAASSPNVARYDEVRPPPAPPEQASAGGKTPPWSGTERELIARIKVWHDDPVLFVREMFGAEPDFWQREMLEAVVTELRVGASACKGPGKTCVEAWIVWWFEYTRVDAQAIVTSITGPNLKDNLWKELAYWYSKSPALQHAFEVKGERITHRQHPKTWWVSARSWAQDADATQQANSLAGFHGNHVLVVLDEMGDYPEGVVQAAEGIFANAGVAEARLVAAWNPTRTDGPAYRICTKDRRRWKIVYITGDPDDPRRSPRISVDWARQMIEDWGRDSDVVRVNVLGLFPRSSPDNLLGPDDITLACSRDADPRSFTTEPIIYGLDVARFGDDSSRLRCRQGPVLFRGRQYHGLDGPTLAQKVAYQIELDSRERFGGRRPDYIFVDVTGVGSSAFDHLCLLGYRDICVPVDFGGEADSDKFIDKRAEIWWRAAQWTKKRGCIPQDSGELGSQLCGPTFSYRARGKRTAFILESKDDMKKRGLPSPDDADAFALTFVVEVPVRRDFRVEPQRPFGEGPVATEYSPLG